MDCCQWYVFKQVLNNTTGFRSNPVFVPHFIPQFSNYQSSTLLLRLDNSWGYTSSLPYIFMAWHVGQIIDFTILYHISDLYWASWKNAALVYLCMGGTQFEYHRIQSAVFLTWGRLLSAQQMSSYAPTSSSTVPDDLPSVFVTSSFSTCITCDS